MNAGPEISDHVEQYKSSTNGNGPSRGPAPWPDPIGAAAYHGPAGEFIERVAEHSEADLAALLLQYLVAAGNLFGNQVGMHSEGDYHPARLYVALVGRSAKGRKGVAWGRVRQVCAKVDPEWTDRIGGGLGSGEGPMWEVRDTTWRKPKKGEQAGEDGLVVDVDGVTDKRFLVVETELSRHFDVMARQGNTLSETVRRLWDGGTVRVITKNTSIKATDPQVSLIGHITQDELARKMTDTEAGNGWGNRFLWVAVQRRQKLPFGGDLPYEDLVQMQQQLALAVEEVRGWGERRLEWAAEARDPWVELYNGELALEPPGMLGAITSRAEPQALRLAVCYALLDRSPEIRLAHLEAAMAVWRYCYRSAEYIFGGQTGDPLADTIRLALERAGDRGLSRVEIHGLLGRNRTADELDAVLTALMADGLAHFEWEETGGRRAQRWYIERETT